MSGHDVEQSTFNHELRPLTAFIDDELSDEEKLRLAFQNGGGDNDESDVKDRFENEPSLALSDYHRTLGDDYTTMDLDFVEADEQLDYDVYLIYESICIKKRPLTQENIKEWYQPWTAKQKILEWFDDALDIPVYVVWHTEECDRFFVRDISSDGPLRELNGDLEFKDWLDEHRPSASDGDGDE